MSLDDDFVEDDDDEEPELDELDEELFAVSFL